MIKKEKKNITGETEETAENKISLLERKISNLEQELSDKDAYILALIHEFKSPLNAILGYSSLLHGFNNRASEMKQMLRIIGAESKRLERLAQKLKTVYNLPGCEPLEMETVSISFLNEQLKNITGYKLLKRGQSLVFDPKASGVTLDPELFLILLKNLVENASDASRDRAVIRLIAIKKEETIIFCVEDHGCGMNMHANRERTEGGAQIGLNLCKRIVKIHGGSIRFESELGKGTNVFIEMPVNRLAGHSVDF